MKAQLKFNIANIPSSHMLDRDNSRLKAEVEQNLTPVLAYSCQYWSRHLCSTNLISPDRLCGTMSQFLQIQALFWIEAMNLLNLRYHCDTILRSASGWVGQVSIEITR
jgi:hypothetical protein